MADTTTKQAPTYVGTSKVVPTEYPVRDPIDSRQSQLLTA